MTSQYQILLLPLQAKLLTLITFSSLLVQTMEFNLLSRSLADLFSTFPKQTWTVFVLTFWTPTLRSAYFSIQWRWICLERAKVDNFMMQCICSFWRSKLILQEILNGLLLRLNCLHTLRRKFIKHPTEHVALKISTLENDLNLQMAHAKSDYEANLINTYAPKNAIQKYIKIALIYWSKQHSNYCEPQPQDKASLFNFYFHSVHTEHFHSSFSQRTTHTKTLLWGRCYFWGWCVSDSQ